MLQASKMEGLGQTSPIEPSWLHHEFQIPDTGLQGLLFVLEVISSVVSSLMFPIPVVWNGNDNWGIAYWNCELWFNFLGSHSSVIILSPRRNSGFRTSVENMKGYRVSCTDSNQCICYNECMRLWENEEEIYGLKLYGIVSCGHGLDLWLSMEIDTLIWIRIT